MRLVFLTLAQPLGSDDVAVLYYHNAVQVLSGLLYRIQVFVHRFVQLLGGGGAGQTFSQLVDGNELDPFLFDRLLYTGICQQVGHSLTIEGYVFVADVEDSFHLVIVECRVIEEEILLARFQLVQRFDETVFLFGGCPLGTVVANVCKLVVFGRIHPVDRRQVVFFGKAKHQLVDFLAEAGREHVPGQMAELGNILQCHFYLCTEFLLHLFYIPFVFHNRLSRIGRISPHHRIKISVLVRQAGTMRQGAPFYIFPFAGND